MAQADLGVVNADGGGKVGTIICFVSPAFMCQRAVYKLGPQADKGHQQEAIMAIALMVVVFFLGLTGV
jgi:hypothetical protein